MEGERNCSDTASHNQSKIIRSRNHFVIADLPEEIIHYILLRLPVKSLLKFRCVSKSWFSLISNPQFIKSHLEFSNRSADFSNHKIMFTTDLYYNLNQCSINSLMSKRPIVASVDFPKKSIYSSRWVVGSCNGIVCIEIDLSDLYLWNPSTKIFKAVPSVDVELPKDSDFDFKFGFGYSESEDDYKVVGVFYGYGNGSVYESMVMIYSLRNNSWKRIGDFSFGVPFESDGRFASGKLHFLAASLMEDDSRWNIVSLDMKTEAYAIVEEPSYEEEGSCNSLWTIGGCLSILCDSQKTRMEVWVMKEYGVKESWTKVVSIPYFNDPASFLHSSPLLIMPNGEILFTFCTSLIFYNPKSNCYRPLRITNVTGANIYVESLVTL